MTTSHTTKHLTHHHGGNMSQKILVLLVIAAALMLVTLTKIASADTAQQPDLIISETTNNMLAALKQDKDLIAQHPGHIHQLANQIIMPHVDIQRMSSWVLGKYWRRASAEQKQQFPAQFKKLILRTYATALSEYTDETITYLPLRSSKDDTDVTVRTIIERNAGPGIPVAYRMHLVGSEWKVYDISIDGISLVSNYRRSFSSVIRRQGLDSLISKLAVKNKNIIAGQQQLASK